MVMLMLEARLEVNTRASVMTPLLAGQPRWFDIVAALCAASFHNITWKTFV